MIATHYIGWNRILRYEIGEEWKVVAYMTRFNLTQKEKKILNITLRVISEVAQCNTQENSDGENTQTT